MSTDVDHAPLPEPVPTTREYASTWRSFEVTEQRVVQPDIVLSADVLHGLWLRDDDGSPRSLADTPTLALIGLLGLLWLTLLPLLGAVGLLLMAPLLLCLSPGLLLTVTLVRVALESSSHSISAHNQGAPSAMDMPVRYGVLFGLTCVISAVSYTFSGVLATLVVDLSVPALWAAVAFSVLRTGYEAAHIVHMVR